MIKQVIQLIICPEGNLANKILLQVMGLDNLNSQLDRQPDGFFDFMDGVTVMADRGKIIFPFIEPFGSHLKKYDYRSDTG